MIRQFLFAVMMPMTIAGWMIWQPYRTAESIALALMAGYAGLLWVALIATARGNSRLYDSRRAERVLEDAIEALSTQVKAHGIVSEFAGEISVILADALDELSDTQPDHARALLSQGQDALARLTEHYPDLQT